jgi:hypothetical protein
MASSSRNLARKGMTDFLWGAESSLSLRMSDGEHPRARLRLLPTIFNPTSSDAALGARDGVARQ